MRAFTQLPLASSMLPAFAKPSAQIDQTPDLGYDELWRLQTQFYTRWKVPNNIKEAESINSTLFSEDIQGRVSDSRTFVGRELNTEYIFGLFMPSESLSIIGQPMEFEITQFAAIQNIASATTRVNFTLPAFNNLSLPVVINSWMTWNSAREISQYDVVFKWFGHLFQTLIASVGGSTEEASKEVVGKLANSICNTHTKHCNGSNAQYESRDECYRFITEDIRVGQSFELGMNTLMCRSVHELMVKYRPEVHCSHIGPTGGGQCDDSTTYVERVEEALDQNSPWIAMSI